MARGVKPPVEERLVERERELQIATERYEKMKEEQEKKIAALRSEIQALKLEKEQEDIFEAIRKSGKSAEEIICMLTA